MNILIKDPIAREKTLNEYKKDPLQFTPLVNSTCTVQGKLSNIDFHEENLTNLTGYKNIIAIDSNFYHWKSDSYEFKNKKKAKKPRKKSKKRTHTKQGDGSSFNSQITFTVLAEFVRDNPIITVRGVDQYLKIDRHNQNATIQYVNGMRQEKITKEYKIKLFRTGAIAVPGVLLNDLSDAVIAVNNLIEYLKIIFNKDNIELLFVKPSMRNYKLMIPDYGLNIPAFQNYCNKHLTTLLNTQWDSIKSFILNPKYFTRSKQFNITAMHNTNDDYLGMYHTYYFLKEKISGNALLEHIPSELINLDGFETHLKSCDGIKNLYVNFVELCSFVLNLNIMDYHDKIKKFKETYENENFSIIPQETLDKITKLVLNDCIDKISEYVYKSKNNIMSHISYNPETFSGFIVRIKTSSEKLTTIKLFSSGKINIDGVENYEDVEFIYYWLNNLFYNNPDFKFNEVDDDNADDDFSFTDEE